jgi:hypothetical protein
MSPAPIARLNPLADVPAPPPPFYSDGLFVLPMFPHVRYLQMAKEEEP